jgi:hypothetical protein
MPDVDSFPIGLPIPISFTITTHTKPIEKDKKSRKDELDFPAPPKTPEDVKFLLLQHVKLKVKLYGGTIDLKHGSVGGFGKAGDKSASIAAAPAKTSVLEPTWIPEAGHGKLGRWRQETRFDTTLMFNCAPNISLEPSIRMLVSLVFIFTLLKDLTKCIIRLSYVLRYHSVVSEMILNGRSRLNSIRVLHPSIPMFDFHHSGSSISGLLYIKPNARC